MDMGIDTASRDDHALACDHLGVGDSSLPDPAGLTYERLASANDVAVRGLLDRLVADHYEER